MLRKIETEDGITVHQGKEQGEGQGGDYQDQCKVEGAEVDQ